MGHYSRKRLLILTREPLRSRSGSCIPAIIASGNLPDAIRLRLFSVNIQRNLSLHIAVQVDLRLVLADFLDGIAQNRNLLAVDFNRVLFLQRIGNLDIC